MTTPTNSDVKAINLSQGRLYSGGAIFIAGFMSPLLVPLVTMLPLSDAWKTAISGLLLLGIPELAMLIAAAVMGKDGFSLLKQWLFGLLKKHFTPPETVSLSRHRIGLILFLLPLLFGWVAPYLTGYFPMVDENRLVFAVIGDLVLLSSLFVLGGEFWDKLRALFIHRVKVTLS